MDASLPDAIGHTPLVRLSRLERDLPGIERYGKLEASNPGGSVKDRAARHMVLEGLRTGALGPGKRLLDATSGNTGIAYAMIGAALYLSEHFRAEGGAAVAGAVPVTRDARS